MAGFIGFFLAKKLAERGDTVIGVDNLNDYYDVALKYGRLKELGIVYDGSGDTVASQTYPNITFIKADLSDAEAMERIFAAGRFDAVCNLAAQAGVRYSLENPRAYVQSNVDGFLNILEGCRNHGVTNLCFASSSSVYGLNKSQPFKTTDPTDHPVSLYAATKKSNEMMAHAYAHLYGIRCNGVRFFTVYGPWGRPDMAPMLFADAILNGRSIKVFNHGDMRRDFTYIDDIINGVISILDNPASPDEKGDPNNPLPNASTAPYRIYNIGNSKPVRLMAFIETLESALGVRAEKNMLPMQPGDVQSTYADVSDLEAKFNYTPSTELAQGVQAFVTWYRAFYGDRS